MFAGKISFNDDKKFDLQLSAALIHQRRLGYILCSETIELAPRLELKSESWQWEQTGNIAVEYEWNGQPSGIAATQADWWVHELLRDDRTLVYLWFPVKRLKDLAHIAIKNGRARIGGDGDRSRIALISLREILR
jgi:hypothetical protein